MYTPAHFREDGLAAQHEIIRAARLCNLVSQTPEGLIATPLPLLLDPAEGPFGTLYGHFARANPHWKCAADGEALAIFMGPDAYVSPAWYATKAETGKVVPTWNYVAVHAYGPLETFDDADRLLDVVSRLSDRHEAPRANPWAVADAPADYVAGMLKGIVGLRMPITRIDGKRKLSQNRNDADRTGVAEGLAVSDDSADRAVGVLIR
jgi:transcriptional regulator